MTNWNPRANDVFLKALELRSDGERQEYLDGVCIGDTELRAEVESLLKASARAGSFLESPAPTSQLAATLAEPPVADRPDTLIGPYKLLEQIGEGGFGVVYLAQQTQPVRRKVALKVLKPGMDTHQVVARFEAERQALALMDHPNIAHVFDGGATTSGRPYFVMELVRGVPITEFCDQNHLPVRQRLELFVSVCQAVQHAHHKGIIHRDLKPSNVLVTRHDDKPTVKVIDFGIAKAVGQQLTDKTLFTHDSQLVGTPLYMSPEQAQLSGQDIDTRTDVYSLGVLLYELLTGTTPFDRGRLRTVGLDEFRRIIREEEPPRPSTRLSTLGQAAATVSANRGSDGRRLSQLFRGELDWIVMQALEKDRNRRYETASAFAADVERYLHDEPVQACPPSLIYRVRKLVRRNRGPVLAAALVLLALVGGMVGMTIGLLRAETALQAEAEQRGVAEVNADRATAAAEAERQAKLAAENAAKAEKAAKLVAQKRLAQIEAANNIVASIFLDLDPRQGEKQGGLRVQLAQQVDKAAELLEGEAIGDPVVVAKLQYLLGVSQVHMGYPQRGIELLDKAWHTRKTHLGPDHRDTLDTMNRLAWAYQAAGQRDKAMPLYEETLAKQQKLLGADDLDTIATMNNLAMAYEDAGRLDKALPLFEQALAKLKVRAGPDHHLTSMVISNLGGAYWADGQLDKALPLIEQAFESMKAKRGPDHPDTLAVAHNLGVAYTTAGRLDKAVPLLEQTLDKAKTQLGADHPDTLSCMYNLARAYKAAGQLDKALSMLEETVAKLQKKFGPDHPDTLCNMQTLAETYQAVKRLDKAIPLLEQTLERMKAQLGGDHPWTLGCMHSLARAYKAAGRLDQAVPLYEQALAGRKKKLGLHHADTLVSMNDLAVAYSRQKQLTRSVLLFEEAVALYKARFGPDHFDTRNTMANLGSNYLQLGRLDEAFALLEDVHAWASEQPTAIQDHFARLFEILAEAYQNTGHYARAEALHWEILQRARKKFGDDDVRITPDMAMLSHDLLWQGKFTDAEVLLRECLALCENKQDDHWTTFRAMTLLGKALSGQRKYSYAEPLLLLGYAGLKEREATVPVQIRQPCLTDAVASLVRLYDAWGMPDKALPWRNQLQATKRQLSK
jgi:serine/threonine protein kinase/tetratricopeptide (TPR) repeat protein